MRAVATGKGCRQLSTRCGLHTPPVVTTHQACSARYWLQPPLPNPRSSPPKVPWLYDCVRALCASSFISQGQRFGPFPCPEAGGRGARERQIQLRKIAGKIAENYEKGAGNCGKSFENSDKMRKIAKNCGARSPPPCVTFSLVVVSSPPPPPCAEVTGHALFGPQTSSVVVARPERHRCFLLGQGVGS